MGRTGITYLDVANAIATIRGNQKNPTVDAIREELKTGSRSTIAKYFQEWKTKNGAKNVTETGIPNELQNLIQALWGKIQSDAEKRIEEHQAEADSEINEAKNSVALTQNQNALLHSDIKTLSEKLDHQTKVSEQLKNTINQYENEKTKMVERISSLESNISDHKNENNRLHTLLKNTQNNLVHYQQAVEQQRQEQALLLEKQRSEFDLKLSQLQNHLNIALQEKSEYQTKFENICESYRVLTANFEAEKNSAQLLQKNGDTLSAENSQLKNVMEKYELMQNKILLDLENKNNENTQLHIKLKTSENDNTSMKNALGNLEHKMQILQEQYEKTVHEKAFLEGQLKQLQSRKLQDSQTV